IDRFNIATRTREALTFRDHTLGFFPTITIANGMQPGFGIAAFADRLFVDWHFMRGSVVTDFQRNIIASFLNRFNLGRAADLNLLASYQRRNDLVFYGTGSDTVRDDRTRFERRKPFIELELATGSGQVASAAASSNGISSGDFATLDTALQALSHFGGRLSIELSDNNFGCTTRAPDICGDDSAEGTGDDRYSLGRDGEAAYFTSGYALMRIKALISADTRKAGRPSSTGVRIDIFGRYGEGLGSRADDVRFFRYGGELSGFWDVTGHRRRVFAARLYVELLERGRNHDVPFMELINLGGPEVMRGFLRARFQGESATVATIDYRWPIWSFLDANLFYEMGNVWDRHLANFDVKKLRGGYGLALRTNSSRDASFQLLIAAGTKQWSAQPDEFRFMAGTNVGF
ncbi:MAG TPA: BamA/TamA family outer membrane protein, partial [Myxococcota bacterium]|nr:BamA/TamA family outer membrane protein [Myxococcota bacterium]